MMESANGRKPVSIPAKRRTKGMLGLLILHRDIVLICFSVLPQSKRADNDGAMVSPALPTNKYADVNAAPLPVAGAPSGLSAVDVVPET